MRINFYYNTGHNIQEDITLLHDQSKLENVSKDIIKINTTAIIYTCIIFQPSLPAFQYR
jgi:hypothetical protein